MTFNGYSSDILSFSLILFAHSLRVVVMARIKWYQIFDTPSSQAGRLTFIDDDEWWVRRFENAST
jgi:hypothetical protein